MQIEAVHTGVFSSSENLMEFILKNSRDKLKEKSILTITSKIVSLAEGRTVNKKKVEKQNLVRQECEHYLGEIGYGCHLAIQHGLLIPSAGIDESNSVNDEYILYPKDPFSSAEKIARAIKTEMSLKNFAVIITDSHTLPLRKGVMGVALAYSGFKAIRNMIGKKDLFGRPLRMTVMNLVDALASSAVLLMGEGAEQCPLAVIYEAPVVFVDKTDPLELKIPMSEDLYNPLYKKHILT